MEKFLLLIFILRSVSPFQVWDCDINSDGVLVRPMDMSGPNNCPEQAAMFEPAKNFQVHILQSDTAREIYAYQCKIIVTREVNRCGFNSLSYGSTYSAFEEVQKVSQKDCLGFIKAEEVELDKKKFKAPLGEMVPDWYYSHGSLDDDGNCEYAEFTSGGRFFKKSYEKTMIEPILRRVKGSYNQATGMAVFENGIRAHYLMGEIFDSQEGRMYWNITRPKCENSVSNIYSGVAELYQRKPNDQLPEGITHDPNKDAILLVKDKVKDQYAGLSLINPTMICYWHCYSTQVHGIVACFNDNANGLTDFKARMYDKSAQIESELGFLQLSSHLKIVSKFEEAQEQICELDRRTIQNKLHAILASKNDFGLEELFGKGHLITPAGTSGYVTQCVAKEAPRVKNFPNCTQEIPVQVKGKVMFAHPISYVLQTFPTIVPCSSVMPILWKINGKWFQSFPNFTQVAAPVKLNVTLGTDEMKFDFTEGLGKGIYSQEEIEAHQEFELVMNSRDAMEIKMTRHAIANREADSYNLGSPLSLSEVDILTKGVMGFLDPIAEYLGQKWIWFTGFCVIISIIMTLLDLCHRICVLYNQRGFGPWLFAALLQTSFSMVSLPFHMMKIQKEKEKNKDFENPESIRIEPRSIPKAPDHLYN